MSTRSSIWRGESKGRNVHFYWELAERETEGNKMTGVPVYIAVESDNPDQEVAIRLPKALAIRLLIALSDNFAKEVKQII